MDQRHDAFMAHFLKSQQLLSGYFIAACRDVATADDLMQEVSETYQMPFFAQPFTFLWLVDAGQRTAATPDGRRKGENLAYSISPMQGRDFRGLSALINSLSKLPQHMAAGSTSAIVEAEPALWNEGNLEHLVTLLSTAIAKGVGQLQFNVVTAETLRKA